MASTNGTNGSHAEHPLAGYSMLDETKKALDNLLSLVNGQMPSECRQLVTEVSFKTINTGSPYFPTPFKETEAVSALKAVEAGIAAGIANMLYDERKRNTVVDIERASCFLFSTYLVTIGGSCMSTGTTLIS